jgi:hypothetical protein
MLTLALSLKAQRKKREATSLARYISDPVGFVGERLVGFRAMAALLVALILTLGDPGVRAHLRGA